jgi:hypothetical protein
VSDLLQYVSDSVRTWATALPWFLPGLVLSAVIGLPLSGPVAGMLRTRRSIAYLLIVSLAAILAATIPPGADGFDRIADGIGTCHLHPLGLATRHAYLGVSEVSLNVLLFIPLGLGLGLLPRTRRTALLVAAAFGLPVAIEAAQLLVPQLGRSCESRDVIDNLLGLVIGLVAGALAVALAGVVRGRS